MVVDATPPTRVWQPSIAALFQPCAFTDNPMCPPLPPLKCRHCCLLHVTVTAPLAKELWVCAIQRHHHRAGPPLSPLDRALDLPFLSAVKSANQKSNWYRLHTNTQEMRDFFVRGLIPRPKLGKSMVHQDFLLENLTKYIRL